MRPDSLREKDKHTSTGIALGAAAYLLWGALPIYWKQLSAVPDLDVLCYRIIWAFVFMCPIVLLIRSWRQTFFQEVALILHDRKTLLAIIAAALLISVNWLTYIYAVSHEMIMEASLGYFLNPLINVLLAIAFLKERLNRSGVAACILAFFGVAVVTYEAGVMPWVSLVLASTFSFYGLIKKEVKVSAYTSLTMETVFMLPLAIVYLSLFARISITGNSPSVNLLLIGTGIVTVIPLLLFGGSARRISYIAISFIQYISPTVSFIVANVIYHEPLSPLKLGGFILIWISIIVYTIGSATAMRRNKSAISGKEENKE